MNRIILYCLVILSINTCGQNRGVSSPTNQFRVKENSYFNYNYTIHSFPYYDKIVLDTCNYCRVKRNEIKAVIIYQFFSETDSVKISTTHYDSLGLTKFMRDYVEESSVNNINCDRVYTKTNIPNKTTKKRKFHSKQIWITDSLGFVVEYRWINKGLIHRWLQNERGLENRKVLYSYDNLHLSVVAKVCSTTKRSFKDCDYSNQFDYKLDGLGNLLSEFYYKANEDRKKVVKSGYTYYYEYY